MGRSSKSSKEKWAERARVNYGRMMEQNGSPGWTRQRRNRAIQAGGILLGVGALAASLVGAVAGSLPRALGFGAVGLLLLALSWPVRRLELPVEKVARDGATAIEVPMRPVPLRIAVGLSVVGLLVATGGVATFLEDRSSAAGIWGLVFGGVVGLALLALGAVNLAGPARRPLPVVVDGAGVTWWLSREPQLVRWEDIEAVEEWSRPIGVGIFRPRANMLRLRTREGALPGWIETRLLAADPATVRDLLRHYLAEPADRATLSRTA